MVNGIKKKKKKHFKWANGDTETAASFRARGEEAEPEKWGRRQPLASAPAPAPAFSWVLPWPPAPPW